MSARTFGGFVHRLGRNVGPVRAAGLVEELDPATGGEQDLGGEPVGVLPVLAPAAGLQFPGDIHEAALAGVLFQHIDEPGLKGHHAVPLGAFLAVPGGAVDVALVGGDGGGFLSERSTICRNAGSPRTA